MKKLRDFLTDMREFFLAVLIATLIFGGYFRLIAMEQEQQKPPVPTKAEEVVPIKTWKLPEYMKENLERELEDFNKRFEAKVQAYKKELKTRFVEFKDMPEDVVLYLEGGFFITRSDLKKLQEQLRDKLNEKAKKEVKEDDKTLN